MTCFVFGDFSFRDRVPHSPLTHRGTLAKVHGVTCSERGDGLPEGDGTHGEGPGLVCPAETHPVSSTRGSRGLRGVRGERDTPFGRDPPGTGLRHKRADATDTQQHP